MRITVQRRLGLPLDVACQAVEAGKKAPNGKPHEELGDAAMVNPRAKHATRHKYLLKRLVKTLRSAWGMLIEMEPTAHLSYSNPKQPDVAAANNRQRACAPRWRLETYELACVQGWRSARLEGGFCPLRQHRAGAPRLSVRACCMAAAGRVEDTAQQYTDAQKANGHCITE